MLRIVSPGGRAAPSLLVQRGLLWVNLKKDTLMKNDIEMQKEVLTELDGERTVIPGSIGVEVHHGVVKLAGRVSDDEVRKTSALAARRVDGVTSVIVDVDVAGVRTAV
jgi:osmotically-inducible protein OsmY